MTASEDIPKPFPYVPGPNAVDITPESNGGVLKEIIKEGEGTDVPAPGALITAHYHGTLLDGTLFDSSKNSGTPFEFNLGKGSVIKAWELGVATMKKGEVAMFTCKPEYAYGKAGSPPKIPPDSTLLFEITLINWRDEDLSREKDGGILRKILVNGEGFSTPNEGALVNIHITGKYEDKVFEDRDVSFNLGEGSEFGVVSGIERALEKFKKGEKSNLKLSAKNAFKLEGNSELGIPPNATVDYVVELKNFEKERRTWDMDTAEQIAQAKILKEKATNYLKAGKYALALKLYKRLLEFISSEAGFDEEKEISERKALLLAVRLNLALVYLKVKNAYHAKRECDEALQLDPDNVKGLFRRGQAYLEMSEPEKAKSDFEAVVKLEPSNKLAANQIIIAQNKIKEHKQKEKQIYANMFEKFAQKDKEAEATRFGWWDDNHKKPIISEIEPIETEDIEEMKMEKRKQLERLKELAEIRRKEREEMLKKEKEGKAEENTENESDATNEESVKEIEKEETENSPTNKLDQEP